MAYSFTIQPQVVNYGQSRCIQHNLLGPSIQTYRHVTTRRLDLSSVTPSRVVDLPVGSSNKQNHHEKVPTTMSEALRTFFWGDYHAPQLVVAGLMALIGWRLQLTDPVTLSELLIATVTGLFWCVQEHFLHQRLLHSDFDWYGKTIHQGHHDAPYFHISIDPAPLVITWFLVAHALFVLVLPLSSALAATFAYGLAGLFYEWSHYIVHTRVQFSKNSYWRRIKDHHARHHLVDSQNWFAFSAIVVDRMFGTNPRVEQVKRRRKRR